MTMPRPELAALAGDLRALRGLPVLVVGLGRSGCAAARWLLARGARVTATDLKPIHELSREATALSDAGVWLQAGRHDDALFDSAALIIVSPGVSLAMPPLAAARQRGTPVISEIDLVAPALGSRCIGITGSNGKSTTTALVEAMLSAAGHEAIACGNFGIPLCDAIQGDHAGRWYSIEISSFQLETTFSLRTCAAILLNIQADHLDRHGSFENYRTAKYRIAELRAPEAPLVLCVDDPEVAALATRAAKPLLAVSVRTIVDEGGMVQDGELRLRFGGSVERLASVQELPVPGRHNQLNILAAAVACRAAGVPLDAVRRGLLKFRALPHRLQEVAQVRGVRFVDDSKATNVGSVLQAIDALSNAKLWVLLGGRDKASDFAPLAAAIEKAGATAITFGEAGRHIADVLTQAGCASLMRSTTLEAALHTAFQRATSGDIVLLSPACASFDAYTGYAARGDHFAQLARSLSEANA